MIEEFKYHQFSSAGLPCEALHSCPFLKEEQTTARRLSKSANDPACVKTRASRECAELFSPFSSLDCDCQCCSFPIQRNRDKISTRKFDLGVSTQAGLR